MSIRMSCFSISLLLILLFFSACAGKEPPKKVIRPVLAMKVGNIRGMSERAFPGRAEAYEEVNLGFEVAGKLIELTVNKGDAVQVGQLLARLDPRNFENSLKASKAEMARAVAHRDRIAKAAKAGAVSQQEFTDAQARVLVAQADVRIKEKSLEDSTIVAPFNGLIATTYVENFQAVQQKQIVLRLLDISKVKMTIDVPESSISLVPYATDLKVMFDAFPGQEFLAMVKEIGTEASKTTRTYPVTLVLEQSTGFQILPGMAGEVRGYAKRKESTDSDISVFEIPISAVAAGDKKDTQFVWVIDDESKRVSKRDVSIDKISSMGIKVLGLKTGEWIATAGVHSLIEGQQVRIQER